MKPALLIAAFFLTACAGSEQIKARMASEHDAKCRSFGAQPGTDAYLQCRLALERNVSAERAAIVSGGAICNQVGTAVVCN